MNFENDDEDEIERILNQKVSLETSIIDYLLIAGWDYWRHPLYRKALKKNAIKCMEMIMANTQKRRKGISIKTRSLESRFYVNIIESALINGYKTLGDLKIMIEKNGVIFRNVGYISFAHFNTSLKSYGIEPFKVGGYGKSAGYLKRYGLELAKD